MEDIQIRGRGRGNGERRGTHRNKQWVAGHENGTHGADAERWERGGYRGGRGRGGRGRGTGSGRSSPFLSAPQPTFEDPTSGTEDEGQDVGDSMDDAAEEVDLNNSDDPEERERFWKELVKAREVEKKRMIAEKKWADPDAPMRLEDAITPVGTCVDMCPRFERYRREREHNLDRWEVIPGTKRVDHARAVKMYERASGSRSIPSDLRTPEACRMTLDYLFHDLIPRGGFADTHSFVRDRSRAVRNDFTPQLITGPIAIECHDRCARFHIVAMHLMREVPGFDLKLEEQQLSHSLLSLQQFYEDQRKKYSSPTELEMRVYSRLISVRNLRERHEDVPMDIRTHPVFELTTKFLQHVQKESAPISRVSPLRVGQEGMQIFGELAAVLREQNNTVMIYLMACILERLFGKDTIEEIESIRGSLSIPEVIDGVSQTQVPLTMSPSTVIEEELMDEPLDAPAEPAPVTRSATEWLSSSFHSQPSAPDTPPISSFTFSNSSAALTSEPTLGAPKSAFAGIKSAPNVFGTGTFGPSGPTFGGSPQPPSVFGGPRSAFSSLATTPSILSPPAPALASSPPPAVTIPGAIFSLDVRNKPFGGLSAVAFSPSTSSSVPAPQPPLASGTTAPRPAQEQPAIDFATPQRPILNAQAAPFIPSPPASSFTPQATSPSIFAPQAPLQSSQITDVSLITPPPAAAFPPPTRTPTVESASNASPKPRIIERKQTLWEFPGTESPQRARPQRSTPTVEIPVPSSSGMTTVPSTPTEPPPLNKPAHLPLPPTPTARWFDPNSQPQSKPRSSSSLLRKHSLIGFPLQMPTSPTPAEILSPLNIPSPGSMKWGPPTAIPASPTPAGPSDRPPSPLLITEPLATSRSKGKGKQVDRDFDVLAADFQRTHSPEVKYFKKWVKKATDFAAWQEACWRSDAYKDKISGERSMKSFKAMNGNARSYEVVKRRASTTTDPDHLSKRARRRKSVEYKAAINDEELVLQLKENQEEHQRRWAQGSFLRTVRKRVAELSPDEESHAAWRTWLTLNTENDGTAIWLEHKFDLPHSGEWISDSVFSMPAIPHNGDGRLSLGSPGLVIFERSPLEGIPDSIERKYRVLDDCARLRDIVEGLASDSKSRFLPSLLIMKWSEGDDEELLKDFNEMTQSFVQAGTIKDIHTFSASSTAKDLDKTFEELLDSMELDVEDRLTQTVFWQSLIDMFIGPFRTAASDWLYSCWVGDRFGWPRYNEVIKSIEDVQDQAVRSILSVLGKVSEVRTETPIDTQAPAHLGIDYAVGPFLDSFIKVAVATAERYVGGHPSISYRISRDRLDRASKGFQSILDEVSTRLRESGASTLQKWTKRRANDDISPTSTPKRLRPSLSRDTSETDISVITEDSPPPSTLAASTAGQTEPADAPPITAAMLRALARDILKSRA